MVYTQTPFIYRISGTYFAIQWQKHAKNNKYQLMFHRNIKGKFSSQHNNMPLHFPVITSAAYGGLNNNNVSLSQKKKT